MEYIVPFKRHLLIDSQSHERTVRNIIKHLKLYLFQGKVKKNQMLFYKKNVKNYRHSDSETEL